MCSLLQPDDSAEGKEKEKFSQDIVSVNKAVEVVLHFERCIIVSWCVRGTWVAPVTSRERLLS